MIIVANRSLVVITKAMRGIVAVAQSRTSFISIAMARLLDCNTIITEH